MDGVLRSRCSRSQGVAGVPGPDRQSGDSGNPGPSYAEIRSGIAAEAKAMGINLSQTLEDELRKRVKEEKIRRWSEDNKEAIESHNRFIEEHGIWSEKYRSW